MSKKRRFKQELFGKFARIGKALASGSRMELLDLLSQAERTVEQLADLSELPVGHLKARWRELAGGKEIVAYCRGPYCVPSDEAVALLRRRGRETRRLETGMPDWRAGGLPEEVGAGAASDGRSRRGVRLSIRLTVRRIRP
jgi:rhodanese-related sulfurtransferase